MSESKSQHTLKLARDLLDDIELSRLGSEQLLLKASRLARLVDATEVRMWLDYELNGYPNTENGRKYMDRIGRWIEKKKNLGYWNPLAGINGTIVSMQTQIQQLQVPNVHLSLSSANPNEFVSGFGGSNVAGLSSASSAVLSRLQALTTAVTNLTSIRSRVLSGVHSFTAEEFNRLAFSGVAESIFQQHQVAIDALLRDQVPDVLEKIPAISDRLASGDGEAISQAMNSCRRMIKAFADTVYPPREDSITVDGKPYEVGSDKVLNRITLYVREHCASVSRRDRLIRNLRRIHERTSVGSHTEVSAEEARALFLQTYLTLGEILSCS